MRALITGASSGIGREIAKVLAGMGYDLDLVARYAIRLMMAGAYSVQKLKGKPS